jgi:AraC-like DNA-binding protein
VQVLAVASRALIAACEPLGLDGDALLAEVGLDREALADPELRIPATQADALWRALAERTNDPDLALHAAEQLPFGAYRVIDYLAAHAPTLGGAFERVAAYFPLIDPRARIVIREHEGRHRVALVATLTGTAIRREAAEYTLAALLLRTRAGTGLAFTPTRVWFSTSAPESTRELERVFGCPLEFDADLVALELADDDWTTASRQADSTLFEVLERHAAMLLAALPPASPLVAELRRAITAELRQGEPTLAQIGKRLGMSGRTLQRRLDDEQLRFGAMVDEIKAELAKARLADRSLAICEVAFLLGFADQSAFSRAFKRWTGMTPARWRRQNLRS